MVTATGYGRHGATSTLTRGLRAEMTTQLELDDCVGLWGLRYSGQNLTGADAANADWDAVAEGAQGGSSSSSGKAPEQHRYLVLSRATSTMVLFADDAEEELVPLDEEVSGALVGRQCLCRDGSSPPSHLH